MQHKKKHEWCLLWNWDRMSEEIEIDHKDFNLEVADLGKVLLT